MSMTVPGFHVAVIIPTGVGARIGGFGGDAMTLLPVLGSFCDTVITHPNVANAACFQALPPNGLYVEGYGLDRFFDGSWALQPVRRNRVGVIWDSGIPHDMEILHRNVVHAVQTVYGVELCGWAATSAPVDMTLNTEPSGRSAGVVNNPEVMLAAGEHLRANGATALAVCCLMPEVAESDENTAYKAGGGVDPIGGLEAMISHWLVSRLACPVAHAPVFPYDEALPVVDELVDPRAASEFTVSTFLPCVLTGLSRAPQFVPTPSTSGLCVEALSALLVPGDALGSLPVLQAVERGIPVLAVDNNTTVMDCTADALGLTLSVIRCATYMDAIGHLVAMKAGIQLPRHFAERVEASKPEAVPV